MSSIAASAEALRDGGPWGQGYPGAAVRRRFEVLNWRVVGERHLKLELGTRQGARLNAIHFGGWTGEPPPPRFALAYRLEPDDYRGGDAVQLMRARTLNWCPAQARPRRQRPALAVICGPFRHHSTAT